MRQDVNYKKEINNVWQQGCEQHHRETKKNMSAFLCRSEADGAGSSQIRKLLRVNKANLTRGVGMQLYLSCNTQLLHLELIYILSAQLSHRL